MWTCEFGKSWKDPPCQGECVLFYYVPGIDPNWPWLVARCKEHPLEELYKKEGFQQLSADEFLILEVHEA
jgi:hypothetical protein